MAAVLPVQRKTRASLRLWPWVLLAALLCFFSTSWQFTRAVNASQLVDVRPGQTLLPLLLFVLIGVVGRKDPRHARRVILMVASGIVLLTGVALPIVLNRAIDVGQPAGAWPLDWLVPVSLHFRSY